MAGRFCFASLSPVQYLTLFLCIIPRSKQYTRAYLHTIVQREAVACHLLTIHNIAYQLTLMHRVRESIMEDRYGCVWVVVGGDELHMGAGAICMLYPVRSSAEAALGSWIGVLFFFSG